MVETSKDQECEAKKQIMFTFIFLVFCAVAASLSSVYAGEDGPATMEDVDRIMFECAEEHGITIPELQAVLEANDVKKSKSCIWACTLKRTGFLDDKGQYILNPGLTYVKNIVKNDEAYSRLENIAKQCESVKDEVVSDGEAGCEKGALVAACFLEMYDNIQKTQAYNNDKTT